jgi:hypothetical protein
MHHLTIFFGTLLFATSAAVSMSQNQAQTIPADYEVYAAVFDLMDHIPKKDPHVTIFDETLNGKCGGAGLPLLNGCSFLWMEPGTASSVKRLLREEWPHLDDSTWANCESNNAASMRLHEPIVTPWKYKLIAPGDGPEKDWESPDMTVFLSRGGFNKQKAEAVAYVLICSYMDQVKTGGNYFLFRRTKAGIWNFAGRVTYLTEDKP